jgi:hypothetical protein
MFLVGDFDAPSMLDRTDATVGSRDHVEHATAW